MCGSAVFTTAMSSIRTAVARHTTARVPCLTFMVRLLLRPRARFMSGCRIGRGRCGDVAQGLRLAQQLGQALPGDLRLRDEAAGSAALHPLVEVGPVAARGEDDGRGIFAGGQARGDLEAVDARHVHVEQYELRVEVAGRCEGG